MDSDKNMRLPTPIFSPLINYIVKIHPRTFFRYKRMLIFQLLLCSSFWSKNIKIISHKNNSITREQFSTDPLWLIMKVSRFVKTNPVFLCAIFFNLVFVLQCKAKFLQVLHVISSTEVPLKMWSWLLLLRFLTSCSVKCDDENSMLADLNRFPLNLQTFQNVLQYFYVF